MDKIKKKDSFLPCCLSSKVQTVLWVARHDGSLNILIIFNSPHIQLRLLASLNTREHVWGVTHSVSQPRFLVPEVSLTASGNPCKLHSLMTCDLSRAKNKSRDFSSKAYSFKNVSSSFSFYSFQSKFPIITNNWDVTRSDISLLISCLNFLKHDGACFCTVNLALRMQFFHNWGGQHTHLLVFLCWYKRKSVPVFHWLSRIMIFHSC